MTPRRKLLVVLGAAALVALVLLLALRRDHAEALKLDDYGRRVAAGDVATAEIDSVGGVVSGELVDGTRYTVTFPTSYGETLTTDLLEAGVEVTAEDQRDPLWLVLATTWLPVLLLVGAFVWMMGGVSGAGRRALTFGRARSRKPGKDTPEVGFDDVAGCEEAVEELREIVAFLEDPDRFAAMGARIPRGVLLVGPPGTGKTLLARAVAGEAGVPFFSISGSDFVELFVGVGASRVRTLFDKAKEEAPAIVFIDEIDAVGRHRGAGVGGGHDEREQTLNQMLVEMDGFDAASGVVLVAATNRPDILDPALLRPGRFDRQIVVDAPDVVGRRAILAVHAAGKPLADDVDLEVIARRTPGFTGADLANTLNEAALLAARHGEERITRRRLDEAVDRVVAGPERRSRVMSARERRVVAYHEAGHALVGHVLPATDPIHKVSILARGRALGWTQALPDEDRLMRTRAELRDEMAMLLGGRTAEELVLGDPTTGAQNDIERATTIARAMVTQFGMSDRIGPVQVGPRDGEVFLGKEVGHEAAASDAVATVVDDEVRRLVEEAHDEARAILTRHREVLDHLAAALLEHETLDDGQLAGLLGGLEPWAGPSGGARPDGFGLVGEAPAAVRFAVDPDEPAGRRSGPAERG